MKKKLDERFYPQGTSLGKASGGDANKPGGTGMSRQQRSKRDRPPVINLDKEDDGQKPVKRSRRSRGGRDGKSKKDNTSGSDDKSKFGSQKKPLVDKNPSKTNAALQKTNEDDDGGFQDTFDVDRSPEGWQAPHSTLSRMSKEDPSMFFLKVARERSMDIDRRVEEEWDRDNLINPTVGSANAEAIIDPSPYLRSFHIPADHRSHLFVPVSHIKAMRQLLTLWGRYCEIRSMESETGDEDDVQNRWKEASDVTDYMATSFFRRKNTELNLAGYCILGGLADPLSVPDAVLESDDSVELPESFPRMSVHEFFDRVHKTFPGEQVLRNEDERGDWNPIVNSGIVEDDENKRDMGVARYSSTLNLLMNRMESGDMVRLAERRAHLDVWVSMALASLDIDRGGSRPVFIPRTGGRFLLTGKHCERQTGHNDFPVRNPEDSPGYFAIVTGAETATIWVAPGSHAYVFYPQEAKSLLSQSLVMTQITIPRFSIFVGHGHLQHAGAGWTGAHNLRYHIYFSPADLHLPDAIVFAYGDSLGVGDSAAALPGSEPEQFPNVPVRSRSRRTSAGAARLPKSGASSVRSMVVQSQEQDEDDDDFSSDGDDDDEDDNMDIDIQNITDN
jgi:hypothetical protein